MKKECLALVFDVQKMRYYLVGQTIHVISKVSPLRVLMMKPSSLNYCLAKWALLLSQYDMQFITQKAVKGQTVVDFLADHPISKLSKLYEDLPDEVTPKACTAQEVIQVWKLFFDGVSRANPNRGITTGVGVVLVSPNGHVILRGFSLIEPYTNNVAEYNALLLRMQLAEELNIRYIEAYGDSQLIVNQVRGEYEVRNKDLVPYHFAVLELAQKFEGFFIEYIPRAQNTYADALASLATSLALLPRAETTIFIMGRDLYHPKFPLEHCSNETIAEIACATQLS
ncbi:uncharacterized protein LOC109827577 [Asparagus officinalis]|uniref:uncharacterized protein LOC109827577 n=1 Tax=Asparagus officinalis TaxID=4686 RepID=UPI00098E69B5|nr:uncharacterized protein LOC109827577 [Asparagus officinalis]